MMEREALASMESMLRRIYGLTHPQQVVHYLLDNAPEKTKSGEGAVLIVQEPDELSVGVYLSPKVLQRLHDFPTWNRRLWTFDQTHAFAIASEEVSHFHYLMHRVAADNTVSPLELELQGEIDKFLLSYLARSQGEHAGDLFEQTFAALFENFSYTTNLSQDELQRYEEAHRLAKRFVGHHLKKLLGTPPEQWQKYLSHFYRQSPSDRQSHILSR